MKIQCIGSGGAFDTNEPNSSFVINYNYSGEDKVMLFDCGYNIFQELKENYNDLIKDINIVFISHLDDDHIGSLKSLIYYRYFVLGLKTEILRPEQNEIAKEIAFYLKDMNKEWIGSKQEPANIWGFCSQGNIKQTICNHHIQAHGLIIREELQGYKNYSRIFISGDTKASAIFERKLELQENDNSKRTLIFQDFSLWDCVTKQTHACETDCNLEYTPLFLNKMIKYHNSKAELKGLIWEYNKKSKNWDMI